MVKVATAFGRRGIPASCVAPPSIWLDILSRRALRAGRLVALGARRYFHHGLLGKLPDEARQLAAIFATIVINTKRRMERERTAKRGKPL